MSTSSFKRLLRQTAVWWSRTGMDAFGKATYDTPQELLVRWEPDASEIINSQGQKLITKAAVDTVSTSVVVGDMMFLGGLDDLTTPQLSDPESADGAWRVEALQRTPGLRVDDEWRTAYLV